MLVHVLTTKGQGYDIAVANENDQMHQAPPFDRETGDATAVAPAGWTSVFRDEIVRIADERPDVVGITAAMLYPVGLDAFADKFPDRVFDVGIAEQHAVTSAAGMAMGGLHPVVAVYATFLNRAFDQVLLDVALHQCGVTFVLDRAGVTGDDGPSHNGMWDMSLLQVVPRLRLAAPRDGSQLRELLREAVDVDDAPTVVRFAKGAVGPDVPAIERLGSADVLARDDAPDVFVLAVGSLAQVALDAAAHRPPVRPRRHGRRPALGQAVRPRGRRSRGPAPPGRHRRGQRTPGWRRRMLHAGAARRRVAGPGAGPRRRAGVPRPRQARRHPDPPGAHPRGHRRRHRGVVAAE